MNKRYETQIKLINNELKKLELEKADIFKKYINYIKKHSQSVFISTGYNYKKIITNIDPSIKDGKYILANIIKYKKITMPFTSTMLSETTGRQYFGFWKQNELIKQLKSYLYSLRVYKIAYPILSPIMIYVHCLNH